MKLRIILLSGIILLCSTMLWAQDTDKEIQQIRKEYQRINKAKLTSKTIKWENDIEACLPPEMSGSVTYFYEKNKLVKIYSEGGEDSGEWKEEYYFKNGVLFFIYQNNAWGGTEQPTFYKVQRRIYIRNNKAFNTLETVSSKDINKATNEEINGYIKIANALSKTSDKKEVTIILSCGVN